VSPIPGCDRHLDAEVVRTLLREQFPQLAGEPVAYLAEGYDHQMYEVGEWLFRFPKRAEVVPWFVHEVEALTVIEPVIGVPVPRFEYVGQPSEGFPYPFAGYRRLPGIGADTAERIDVSHLAAGIGRALTNLHSIDAALITSVPHQEPEPPVWDFRSDDTILDCIPHSLRDDVGAFLHGEVPRPAFDGPDRVVHSDLLPEHVLVDPSTGALSGIIDFADLSIGDPTGDFVGLLEIGGRELIDATLAHYGCDRDVLYYERLEWRLRAFHLHELVRAVRDGSDPSDEREMVALAFGGG